MTDDPFLPKQPAQGMQPAEPSPQPDAGAGSGAVPTQVPPPPAPPVPASGMPVQNAPGGPEYYQPVANPPQGQPPVYGQPGQAVQPGQYPVPYAPYPPTAYAQQTKPKTWMNWVAFGCGLGALVTCVSFIPAIIFGHLGLAAANRGEADAKGPGIAGLVIGYLFAVGTVAYIVMLMFLFGAS